MLQLSWSHVALAGLLSTSCAQPEVGANAHDVSTDWLSARSSAVAETPLSISCSVYTTTPYLTIPDATTAWISPIAQRMYNEQKSGSCDVFAENQIVDTTNVYVQIIPYTSGSNCNSTSTLVNDRNGLTSAVNQLGGKAASSGCCVFQHGSGTWHAYMKIKTASSIAYDNIACP